MKSKIRGFIGKHFKIECVILEYKNFENLVTYAQW